jgi:phosphoribosylpyrophosphate synthetase
VANIHEDPRYALRVLFAAKALRHTGVKTITLLAPWIAYGRQDRVARPGKFRVV